MALSNLPGGGGSGSTPTDDESDQENSDASSSEDDVARGRRRARRRMPGYDEGRGLGSDDNGDIDGGGGRGGPEGGQGDGTPDPDPITIPDEISGGDESSGGDSGEPTGGSGGGGRGGPGGGRGDGTPDPDPIDIPDALSGADQASDDSSPRGRGGGGRTDSVFTPTPEDRPREDPQDDAGMTDDRGESQTSTLEQAQLDVQGPSMVPGQNPESGAVTSALGTYIESAEVDTDITDELTEGGPLSETADSNEGLLPGSAFGVDLSEERFREDSKDFRQYFTDEFESNEEFTVAGSDLPDRAVTGVAKFGVDLINLPGHLTALDTAVEVGTNAPGVIADEGPGAVAETATGVGKIAGGAIVEDATENPVEFVSGGVAGYLTGAKLSSIVGKTARAGRDRVRTAGGEKVELDDITQEDVVKNVETDGAEGSKFPGADDPDLYQDDPAEAVARQADDMTPDAVDERFTEAGVDDGVVLKKALDTEPSGAGRGARGTGTPTGFKTMEGDYESPGAFVGPELSPNFLRTDARGEISLRPGLPDFGNKPTGVLAKTDVENADADNLQKFNEELVERTGDTTAVTKPAGDVNTGEIEAVLPPGAEFSRLSSDGLGTRALRRFGIGSDFYTEVGGRRVPLRSVAPDSVDGDAGDIANAVEDTSQTLDDYVVTPDTPQDNPLPLGPGVDSGADVEVTSVDSARGGSDTQSLSDASSTPSDAGSSTLADDSGLSDLEGLGGSTGSTTGLDSDAGGSTTSSGGSSSSGLGGGSSTFPFDDSGSTGGSDDRGGSTPGSGGGSGLVSDGGGSSGPTDSGGGGPFSPGSPPTSRGGGSGGFGSPFGGGGGGGGYPYDDGDTPPGRRPDLDFSEETRDRSDDRRRDDSVFSDLFSNPTIGPGEAVDFDAFGDAGSEDSGASAIDKDLGKINDDLGF